MSLLRGWPIILAVALAVSSPLLAAEEAVENPLQEARRLVLDGAIEEAAALLAGAEGDTLEITTLQGVIALERGQAEEAARRFREVLEVRPNRTGVWLYLGRALYELGEYADALDALDRGRRTGDRLPGYFVLRSRSAEHLERFRSAYRDLTEGLELHPGSEELLRSATLLTIRMGLFTEAERFAEAYRRVDPDDPSAWTLSAEALRKVGGQEEAMLLLEEARLRLPRAPELLSQLAFSHAEVDHHRTAADLFARRTRVDGRHAYEAADQYRVLGRPREALRWNAHVVDVARKLPQRVAILVMADRVDGALALLPELTERGLLDDVMRHHLGYAAIKAARPALALELLRGISPEGRDDRVRRLLEVAADCEATPWTCP